MGSSRPPSNPISPWFCRVINILVLILCYFSKGLFIEGSFRKVTRGNKHLPCLFFRGVAVHFVSGDAR